MLSAPFFIVATGAVKAGSMPTRRLGSRSTPGAAGSAAGPRHWGGVEEFDASFDPAGKTTNQEQGPTPRRTATQHGVFRTTTGVTPMPRWAAGTQAQLRYEHRAQLRMKAAARARPRRTTAMPARPGAAVPARTTRPADRGDPAMLKDCLDAHATDHSSSSPTRCAPRGAGHDVAIGVVPAERTGLARAAGGADWRYVAGLNERKAARTATWVEYCCARLRGWLSKVGQSPAEARRPARIVDTRTTRGEPRAAS